MSKYKYKLFDIAYYLNFEDFARSDEKRILDDLWLRRKTFLEKPCCKDKLSFLREISMIRMILSGRYTEEEIEAVNRDIKQIGGSFSINKDSFYVECIQRYFKFIKLRLIYTNGYDYKRMKLRTLISDLGYRRRTAELIRDIKNAVKYLGLEICFKNREKCDLQEAKLDENIIIRTREEE